MTGEKLTEECIIDDKILKKGKRYKILMEYEHFLIIELENGQEYPAFRNEFKEFAVK